jgi:S1-C subfamily serine protease
VVSIALLSAHPLPARGAEPSAGSTVELAQLQSAFQRVADRVAPGVVAISASVAGMDTDEVLRNESMNGDRLEAVLARATRTVGTGSVIDTDGYILTNEHVIGDAGQIWVTTDNGQVFPAIVIGSDPRADLAVLKIPARDLKPVNFAPAGSVVQRGMWTIALGNPYGLAGGGEMSMSVGVVSATDRSLPKLASQENRYYADLIQTTAEINPGNSGGPLFDLNGDVIGISTAVILPQKATNGIGFAIPVTGELLQKVRDLREGREIVYAYLGVMVSTATAQQRRAANIKDSSGGVHIDSIEADSPASRLLQGGDLVVRVNGHSVAGSDDFVRQVGQMSISHPTSFKLYRGGKALTVEVQLRRRELPSVAVNHQNQRIRWRGLLLGPVPANWEFGAVQSRPEHGLMVLGVDPASPLIKEGVRSGTVIVSVAGKPLRAVTDLQEIVNSTPAEQCSVQFAPQAGPPMHETVVSGE